MRKILFGGLLSLIVQFSFMGLAQAETRSQCLARKDAEMGARVTNVADSRSMGLTMGAMYLGIGSEPGRSQFIAMLQSAYWSINALESEKVLISESANYECQIGTYSNSGAYQSASSAISNLYTTIMTMSSAVGF